MDKRFTDLLSVTCSTLQQRCSLTNQKGVLLLLFIALLGAVKTSAQGPVGSTSTITGKVLDEEGNPLPGVTVKASGSTGGTSTDLNGDFRINLAGRNAVLTFTFIGYTSQTLEASPGMTIRMKPDSGRQLEEVVVVGYGTRKKSDVTGAVSSVSEKALRDIPAGNVATALQGTAPGISILKSGGNSHPASAPSIRIRGERSLGANNSPLIILDGVPFNGNLNDISQDDIVSAQILKDASATAIYGSRGSNGVVLINTRRGKNQKAVINYSAYAGFNRVLGQYDVMDADEFLELRKWARVNGSAAGTYTGVDDPSLVSDNPARTVFSDKTEYAQYLAGNNTNWQDMLYESALLTNHQVSVTGGTENTQYDFSGGYYQAGGIYPGQGMKRYSAKVSIDHRLGKFIKVGLSSLNSYN
ncbi:SusC/RagA family TonB-linked outer membrane protein, partial [Arcticibacter sp.]|uniref:SusC/RagA family TonB-linked outer membrane protein n=1 Tax=Arcticibacter sp. TaxID=1872630 RepID=UPI00388E53E7